MTILSRLVTRNLCNNMVYASKSRLVTELYLLSALSNAVIHNVVGEVNSIQQSRFHSHCETHALPLSHVGAPKNASYPHKAWCEVVFRQNYFHREQSGGCYSTFSGDNGLPWTDIDFQQLTSMIKSGNIQLFDVREPEEVKETGMMPLAVNVPLDEVPEAFKLSADEFQKKYGTKMPSKTDENIIFSCLGGVRSRRALTAAHEVGFIRARHYIGGWEEYEEKMQSQ